MSQPETTKDLSEVQWSKPWWFLNYSGTITCVCLALGIGNGQFSKNQLLYLLYFMLLLLASALASYSSRNHVEAHKSIQRYVWILFAVSVCGLAYIQFLGTDQGRDFVDLSPWTWASLAVYPLISMQFWFANRVITSTASR